MTSKVLNRMDFVKMLQVNTAFSSFECQEILEQLLDVIKEGLMQEGEVKIQRFATFRVHTKQERWGRNPKTGEPKVIKVRKVVQFRFSRKGEQMLEFIA